MACGEGVYVFIICWVVARGKVFKDWVFEVVIFCQFDNSRHECMPRPGFGARFEKSDDVIPCDHDIGFCTCRCRGVTSITTFGAGCIVLLFLIFLFLSAFMGFVILLFAVGAFLFVLLISPTFVVAHLFACFHEVSCCCTTRYVYPTFLISEDL